MFLTFEVKGADSPFRIVFIDKQTEEYYGPFPLPRPLLAKGIDEIKRRQAKGIVLKFFLDTPKDPAGDLLLAQSFSGISVLLEARLDDSEEKPNPLPDRFFLPHAAPPNDKTISGQSGWIPLPIFSGKARDIGFVDLLTPEKPPVLEKYQGKFVKSLCLCALELAWDTKAQVFPGERVTIHGRSIKLDNQNQVAIDFRPTDPLVYIPFHKLLSGSDDVGTLEGKVVILGYDGENMHSFDTSAGKIKAHRLFCYALAAIWDQTR